MASGNYREYLTEDEVRAKKYFYVLRPILACRWILDKGTPPPMLFSQLAESELDNYLKPEVERLLTLKKESPEIKLIPRIETLNAYIEKELYSLDEKLSALPAEPYNGWEELDRLFISELK